MIKYIKEGRTNTMFKLLLTYRTHYDKKLSSAADVFNDEAKTHDFLRQISYLPLEEKRAIFHELDDIITYYYEEDMIESSRAKVSIGRTSPVEIDLYGVYDYISKRFHLENINPVYLYVKLREYGVPIINIFNIYIWRSSISVFVELAPENEFTERMIALIHGQKAFLNSTALEKLGRLKGVDSRSINKIINELSKASDIQTEDNIKKALKDNNYLLLINSWKEDQDYQKYFEFFPSINNPKIFSFLKRRGLRLSELSDDLLVELLLTVSSDINLLKIFPNDNSTIERILKQYNEMFTSDDIIRLDIQLSSLLKIAGIKTFNLDEIIEEMMYLDIPDNIQEAITIKLLN